MTTNRKIVPGVPFVSGLAVGVVCYLLAELLVPNQVASPADHDILLANRIGFIYTPIVGLWLGWLQRSWRRALVGASVGIAIGFVYMWLCADRNFLAIMIGFPCLLGCALAVLVGSNRSDWLIGLPTRLGKGLLAGLVLGFVYAFVLNVIFAMLGGPDGEFDTHDFTQHYVQTMWRAGPIALGAASSLFFGLIRWAVGLTYVRVLVFEEVEAPKSDPDGT